jgi:hypothetical protein
MTRRDASSEITARWYRAVSRAADPLTLELVEAPLAEVAVSDGRLVGPRVTVDTHAVLVGIDDAGRLCGLPPEPLRLRNGTLCFDPSMGGARTRENRRARGAFNAIVGEANYFGMVNAYAHTDAGLAFFNRMLTDLGAGPLPPLRVVVGAHFGSRLPGYRNGDGDCWSGSLRPMSGGHYRLSTRTSGVPELEPVAPTGEVHLGPCRYRKPFAGHMSYLRNAAHNPAIIDHELGHHLCRHTADFRLNGERPPPEQLNGKPGVEEGICDYFTAAFLGTARPYGWYRADGGRRRDLGQLRHASERDADADAHGEGATWAAAWWRCREELVDRAFLPDAVDHDRVVVRSLLAVGEVARPGDGRSRTRRERIRTRARTMIKAYRGALREAGGSKAWRVAATIFEQAGLVDEASSKGVRSC